MSEFDDDTAVSRIGDGRFGATLSGGWGIGGGLNGGYLLGVVGRALREELVGKPDPITVSACFLSAATPGPAEVEVVVRRDGGRLATAVADLRQDGLPRVTALATYGDLDPASGLGGDVRTTAAEPVLPPPEECVAHSSAALGPGPAGFRADLLDRLDTRFDPAYAGWTTGTPSGSGVISAWFRLADGAEPDTLSLLLAVDALPPASFDLGMPGWAPTIELTAHVRARPAPGWLKLRHATRNVAGGMFEEDCEVWDSAGRLVAQGRQLARLPRPHAPAG